MFVFIYRLFIIITHLLVHISTLRNTFPEIEILWEVYFKTGKLGDH